MSTQHDLLLPSPIIYDSSERPRDDTSKALVKLESVMQGITEIDGITDADISLYNEAMRRLKYENRVRRLRLTNRVYKILQGVLDQLEIQLTQGVIGKSGDIEPFTVSPNQVRLLIQMFFDQTREEFGDKSPEALVQHEHKHVHVTQVEVVLDKRGNKRPVEVING